MNHFTKATTKNEKFIIKIALSSLALKALYHTERKMCAFELCAELKQKMINR